VLRIFFQGEIVAEYAKKISVLFRERRASRSLVNLRFRGFLQSRGWFKSVELQRAVDLEGNPLPWVSYAFILFIQPRLTKSMDVFEFGAGSSTLFYASLVQSVVSVEHDEAWFQKIRMDVPVNVSISKSDLDSSDNYTSAALNSGRLFDLIIVDGEERVRCLKRAIPALKSTGVIVLDDSERSDYMEGTAYLAQNDFRRLDFWGMSPGNVEEKCTTIFYRKQNCLDI
jgi:hypothetical protein